MLNTIENLTPALSGIGEVDWKEVADKDTKAFQTWKETPTKKNLGVLMKQVHPLIRSEVSKISGALPDAALEAEAKKWAYHAISTYDASKGAKLSTHIMNVLPKTKRLNYSYQTAARRPEHQQMKINEFNVAKQNLSEELGRDPNYTELAGHLGWKVGRVKKFQEQATTDFFESGAAFSPETSRYDETMAFDKFVKTQLSREESALLTLVDKYPGEGRSSATAISNAMGISIHRYNYLKRKLIKKIGTLQTDFYGKASVEESEGRDGNV